MNFLIYFQKRILLFLLLGFVSGAPFLLTLSTLSFRLSEIGSSKTIIGLFMFVSLPYSLKFLWAPIFDQIRIPFLTHLLGQRKSWGILSQFCLIISTIMLGITDPSGGLLQVSFWALCVAFFSASQDIVIDAMRIDLLVEKEVGPAAAMESVGFKMGMMLSGAGALYLANTFNWAYAYIILSFINIIGIIAFLWAPTSSPPKYQTLKKNRFLKNYIQGWLELIKKPYFIFLVLFTLCFKIGDSAINSMISPFMCELGYTKLEFANVTKIFGISMMVAGGILGGLMINQRGIEKNIVFCVVFQCISCLLFVIQAIIGYNITVLYIIVGFESLTSGMISTAFIAYLSSFCCFPFSATHFTVLYSIGSLSRVFVSFIAGIIAEYGGWVILFILTSLLMLPNILFISSIKRIQQKPLESKK